jgi:hypothetical protein
MTDRFAIYNHVELATCAWAHHSFNTKTIFD